MSFGCREPNMATLRHIFQKGVETLFSTFEEAVKTGTYTVKTDDGFTDNPGTTTDTIRCIFEKFTAKDVELLTFYELIQPQDVKGLIPSVDFINCEVSVQGYILFDGVKWTVEGHDLDPMDVIYTLLLRKV